MPPTPLPPLFTPFRRCGPRISKTAGEAPAAAAARTGAVGREHDHEVAALVARAVEHRVERAAQALGHGVRAAAEERVGLVDEEQQALWLALLVMIWVLVGDDE